MAKFASPLVKNDLKQELVRLRREVLEHEKRLDHLKCVVKVEEHNPSKNLQLTLRVEHLQKKLEDEREASDKLRYELRIHKAARKDERYNKDLKRNVKQLEKQRTIDGRYEAEQHGAGVTRLNEELKQTVNNLEEDIHWYQSNTAITTARVNQLERELGKKDAELRQYEKTFQDKITDLKAALEYGRSHSKTLDDLLIAEREALNKEQKEHAVTKRRARESEMILNNLKQSYIMYSCKLKLLKVDLEQMKRFTTESITKHSNYMQGQYINFLDQIKIKRGNGRNIAIDSLECMGGQPAYRQKRVETRPLKYNELMTIQQMYRMDNTLHRRTVLNINSSHRSRSNDRHIVPMDQAMSQLKDDLAKKQERLIDCAKENEVLATKLQNIQSENMEYKATIYNQEKNLNHLADMLTEEKTLADQLLQEKQNKIRQLEANIKEKQTLYTEEQNQIKQEMLECAKQKEDAIRELKIQIVSPELQIKQKNKQISNYKFNQETVANLQQQLEDIKAQHRQELRDINEQRNEDLEKRILENKQSKESEIAGLQKHLKELQDKNIRYNNELGEVKHKVNSLEIELRQTEALLQERKNETNSLNDKLSSLESENTSLRKQTENKHAYLKNLEALQIEYSKITKELSTCKQFTCELERSLQQYKDELHKETGQTKALTKKLRLVESEHTHQLTKLKELTKELDSTRHERDELIVRLNRLHGDIRNKSEQQLQGQQQILQQSQDVIEKRDKQFKELTEKNNQLQDELWKEKETNKCRQEQSRREETESKSLSRQLGRTNSEYEEEKKLRKYFQAEKEELTKRLRDIEFEKQKLQQVIQTQTTQLVKNQREKPKDADEKERHELIISNYRQEKENLEKCLKELRGKYDECKSNLIETHGKLKTSEHRVTQYKKTIATCKSVSSNNEDLEHQNKKLQCELVDLKHKLVSTERETISKGNEIQNLLQQIQELEKQKGFIEVSSSELHDNEREIQKLTDEKKTLKQERDHFKREHDHVNKHLEDLRREYENCQSSFIEISEKLKASDDLNVQCKKKIESLESASNSQSKLEHQTGKLQGEFFYLKQHLEKIEGEMVSKDEEIHNLLNQIQGLEKLEGLVEESSSQLRDKQREIQKLTDETKTLKQERDNFERDKNLANESLEDLRRKYYNCKLRLKEVSDKLKASEDLISRYKKEFASLKSASNIETKLEQQQNTRQHAKLKGELNVLKQNLTDAYEKLNTLKRRLSHSEQEIATKDDKIHQLNKHIRAMNNRVTSHSDQDDARQLQTENDELKAELDETKARLSKMMSDKLTDNNPNITDLSDMNRPTKLAERYTELYDNQWTDAFEVIDNGDEVATINKLLDILYSCEEYCRRESERQMEMLQQTLAMAQSQTAGSQNNGITGSIRKALKNCRKEMATTSGEHLFKRFMSSLRGDGVKIPSYVKECFLLCWLMNIQDPPVVLGSRPETGSRFDTNLYRAFTESGNELRYLVWPVMYLCERGSTLMKGVAQGMTRRK